MTATSWRRRLYTVVALFAAAIVVTGPAAPAAADPGDEGGTTDLRKTLETANRGYLDAQAALDSSKKRQAEIGQQLATAESRHTELAGQVAEIAATAYRTPPLSLTLLVVEHDSPDAFLDRAATVAVIAARKNRQISEVTRLRTQLTDAKAALDAELAKQQEQLAVMAKKKQDAERALAAVGSGQPSGGFSSAGAAARPGERSTNGSLRSEVCSVDDPTTTGCITPRLLHAMQQAQGAGFTRFVSCFRPGNDGGEHPKGRACDFAAARTGFGGVATGDERSYGDNLAAYFMRNANALGVLYVIWFRQIWMPSTGWRAYRGGGDPASDHTNHVHLSVY